MAATTSARPAAKARKSVWASIRRTLSAATRARASGPVGVPGTCPTHHGCDRRRAAHRRLETGERGADPGRSGGRATARQTAERAGQAEWLVLIRVRRTPAHVMTARRLNRLKPIPPTGRRRWRYGCGLRLT